ncbi:hypothetical protein NDU88_010172 [Pleurodeles waltl]|uniref:Uncharacterized protein n=1 Tax=Pleurodeles waltl TaxID=8319 RepID=A0AAV7Q1E9_PLEWA|nr:hypothetical protein NDU88_010172 [Pleurodeles waltl]
MPQRPSPSAPPSLCAVIAGRCERCTQSVATQQGHPQLTHDAQCFLRRVHYRHTVYRPCIASWEASPNLTNIVLRNHTSAAKRYTNIVIIQYAKGEQMAVPSEKPVLLCKSPHRVGTSRPNYTDTIHGNHICSTDTRSSEHRRQVLIIQTPDPQSTGVKYSYRHQILRAQASSPHHTHTRSSRVQASSTHTDTRSSEHRRQVLIIHTPDPQEYRRQVLIQTPDPQSTGVKSSSYTHQILKSTGVKYSYRHQILRVQASSPHHTDTRSSRVQASSPHHTDTRSSEHRRQLLIIQTPDPQSTGVKSSSYRHQILRAQASSTHHTDTRSSRVQASSTHTDTRSSEYRRQVLIIQTPDPQSTGVKYSYRHQILRVQALKYSYREQGELMYTLKMSDETTGAGGTLKRSGLKIDG